MLARTADSRPGPSPDTLAAQREAARRTEEKINQIESEMIAAGAVARAAASPGPATMARALAPTVPQAAARAPAQPQHAATSLLGDQAGAMAIDVHGSALPSVLEEAAILYSNGQPQPAELALRQALDDAGLGAYRSLAWLMLLDLHQAQGDRPAFEALALDYAARFESSPPGWSEQLGAQAVATQAAPDGGTAVGFQARLDGATAAQVDSILKASARRRETVVDFTRVESVDAPAADALLRLFRHFEKSSSNTLAVRGAEPLFAAARNAIEPGRRDPSESGWMLALQALRVLGRQQAFEDLSIEYCVTYEVSPPSWEPIGERIRAADGGGCDIDVPAAMPRQEPSAFALRGDVLGRMQAELQALRAYAVNRGDVVVDCRGLRRMEFVAAGDLLNEVVTLHSAGKQVLFVEPNYLVYALMLVMGIQELAEIRRRKI
ncbi:MAG: hypothetical protein KJ011_18840 [Burkholderiaceae bacterium]|nr:hypothetical protein [Burkholderiaceae bacterium]